MRKGYWASGIWALGEILKEKQYLYATLGDVVEPATLAVQFTSLLAKAQTSKAQRLHHVQKPRNLRLRSVRQREPEVAGAVCSLQCVEFIRGGGSAESAS